MLSGVPIAFAYDGFLPLMTPRGELEKKLSWKRLTSFRKKEYKLEGSGAANSNLRRLRPGSLRPPTRYGNAFWPNFRNVFPRVLANENSWRQQFTCRRRSPSEKSHFELFFPTCGPKGGSTKLRSGPGIIGKAGRGRPDLQARGF